MNQSKLNYGIGMHLHLARGAKQGSKLEAASLVPMTPKDRNLGVKFMTTFKVMVVKAKFIVAKYD